MGYKICKDLCHKFKTKYLPRFKNVRFHLVSDVHHDERCKSRQAANGYLKEVPLSSVCSGIVLSQVIRLVLFLDELN